MAGDGGGSEWRTCCSQRMNNSMWTVARPAVALVCRRTSSAGNAGRFHCAPATSPRIGPGRRRPQGVPGRMCQQGGAQWKSSCPGSVRRPTPDRNLWRPNRGVVGCSRLASGSWTGPTKDTMPGSSSATRVRSLTGRATATARNDSHPVLGLLRSPCAFHRRGLDAGQPCRAPSSADL